MASSYPKKGILAALWLPTDAEGNLLKRELAANIGWLKSKGIHGVLALGSTGEFPQMSADQRKEAISAVIECAAPLPVVVNISDIRPGIVGELGRHARAAGACAVAIMPPGFYPSTQDDVLAHFLYAAEHADLPVFLYNFPELTGTRINVDTVAKFADRANMAGIKQSGGEFDYHKELVALGKEKNYVVFSGADTRLAEVFKLGAVGCIGGLVNIVPDLMLDLYNICQEGKPGDPGILTDRIKFTGAMVDRLTFPLNVSAGMAARGRPVGEPKARVSPESKRIHDTIIRDLSAAFNEWGLECANAENKMAFASPTNACF
ncbi:dihydrodipicolinate synthase/N-acetylneuraminate lyase [Ereboglobus sp. PH5-5]|uniref:dihydrodipicolinate synthase family protein n=1 Tax=Ereboglobus sp. PH5-5 TaxID=2940529 RepID=UPI002405E103|nr:dihydrodipicolinate synthase family protein [Ereboglobus sp. PH5-5]MDF9831898.1 dihydrodipicolinate synthase/N-acetylneuraminate lyase [Ereboglobus sp. PH5-5]